MLRDIQQLKKYKILVIGESCLDVYSFLEQKRMYKETRGDEDWVPVFVLKKEIEKPGMGANVKENFVSLGCQIDFLTNEEVIVKKRLINNKNKHHIARIDTHDQVEPLDLTKIKDLNLKDYSAIVISDYDKGFINKNLSDYLTDNFQGPVFVDSKKRDLSQFERCILKINELEFKQVEKFPREYQIVVTQGAKGALYEGRIYKPVDVEVIDVCGAGDNFLVGLCLGVLQTNSMEAAISLGNYFASLALGHIGNHPVSLSDIS